MKKAISLLVISFLIINIISSFSFTYADDNPRFTGTFIQSWVYKNWDDERAENEFKQMKKIGIDTLIMGDLATKNETWSVEYPSKIEEFNGANSSGEYIVKLLNLCKKYDIKLYLGLGNDAKWWNSSTDLTSNEGRQWFIDTMKISSKIAKELYDLYKKDYKDTFAGYFNVYEIWNNKSWDDDLSRNEYIKTISEGFNIVIETINSLDKNMPLIFSPFSTNSESFATKENTQKFYTELINITNFRKTDAIAPMDNCVSGGQTVDTIEEWTLAYYNAVKTNNDKLQLWANCESCYKIENSDSGNTTAPVNRIIKQLKIASKYVTKIISFSYPHYMSPYNTIEGFNKAYENYISNGKIDTTPPTTITRVKTEVIDDSLVVKWAPAKDEYSIAQYRISKLNLYSKQYEIFISNTIGREDGTGIEPKLKCSFVDKYYNKKSKNVYIIEAMDCSGNYSEKAYIVVDGTNPSNGINLEDNDDNKGFYSPTEYENLKLSFDINEQINNTVEDKNTNVFIISCCVVVIALVSVVLSAVITSALKKKKSVIIQRKQKQ